MHDNALETLLEKLNQGDDTAIAAAFEACGPFLRLVARRRMSRRLQAKFDSVDIVQSVWADLVQGFRARRWQFEDVHGLRAFLVQATRNRFLNRARHHRAALSHERLVSELPRGEVADAAGTRASEVAQAEDVWDQLLAGSPPSHREILRLRRDGRSLAEIAAHTGLHPGSVRRILYDLARRLARQPQPQ